MTQREFYSDRSGESPLPAAQEVSKSSSAQVIDGKSIEKVNSLELYSRNAREWAGTKQESMLEKFKYYKARFSTGVAKTSEKYKEIVKEPLLPQSLYVLTATLLGSVLARRKGGITRFLTPSIFGLVVFGICMPKTFQNSKHSLSSLESKYFPEFKVRQDMVTAAISDNADNLKIKYYNIQPVITEQVTRARRAVEDWWKKS